MSNNYPHFNHYHRKKIHMGICGSVAAYKMVDLMRHFLAVNIDVSVTLTPSARKFISPLTFESLGASIVYTDMFHSSVSPFEHLEPGQIADAMIIAPATASTLARLTAGQADELLACQALAFDKPILLAPAMNPKMWDNPATQQNIEKLVERGYFIVNPEQGLMACEENGMGRLANPYKIYLNTLKLLTEQDLFGKKILITLGPTVEKWDAVRIWSNQSSGNMGMALALVAWLRGAEVHAVAGPNHLHTPQEDGFFYYPIESAQEMFTLSDKLWDDMDMGFFTAAVADFHPTSGIEGTSPVTQDDFNTTKFKKDDFADGFNINFAPNEDILKNLGEQKQDHQKIMGFAAESAQSTEDEAFIRTVQAKLRHKNCDMMVGNLIHESMGKNNNRAFIADTQHNGTQVPLMSKHDLAWHLIDHIQTL